jgi:O-antigen/teichoic acid export membrane protein
LQSDFDPSATWNDPGPEDAVSVSGDPPPAERPADAPLPSPVDRILRNSALNLAAQAVNAFCNLAVVFILARSIGKAGLGQYFTLFAAIMAVQLIVEGGLGTMLTYRIAHRPETWRNDVAEAAGLFCGVVTVSALVLLILGALWSVISGEPGLLSQFAAAAAACAAIQVQRFCVGVFRAFERFGRENFARALQGMLFAVLVAAVAASGGAGVTSMVAMLAASHLVASTFLLVSLHLRWRCLRVRWGWAAAKDWVTQAVPLGLGDVVRGLTWQLDTLLLRLLQGATVVGIYSVAYRPLGPLNWISQSVLAAAFPAFSRMAGRRAHELQEAFAHSTRVLWAVSIPIVVAIFVCAEPLVALLAGPQYLEAVYPMRILIWVTALSFLSLQLRFVFTAMGLQHVFARLVFLVFAIEAVLELLLIPRWGYYGACAGTLAGEIAFTGIGLLLCRRLGLGTIPWTAMLRVLAAGLAMGAALWFARTAAWAVLVPAAALAAGLYLLLCLWWGALRTEELGQFTRALRGLVRFGVALAVAGAAFSGSAYAADRRGAPAQDNRGLWMEVSGRKVFLLGANYPWYNGFRGLDLAPLGGAKPVAAVAFWKGRDLQRPPAPIMPGSTGFNAEGIAAQLADMHGIGIHVLRWFLGNDGRAFLRWDAAGSCAGIDPVGLANLDRVLALAEQHHVRLAPCLLDFRFVTGDPHVLYADGTAGESRADVLRDPRKRAQLMERFVAPLVVRYADSKAILYWEIMNEAANAVSGVDPVTGFRFRGGDRFPPACQVSPAEMRAFLNDAYQAIKRADHKHPVMPSGLARPAQLPLVVGQVGADLFGAHYNDDGVSDYGRVQPVREIREHLYRKFRLVLDKPLVMTEGAATMPAHLDYYVTSAFEGGWAGYFPWTYYHLIGRNCLIRYDGVVTSASRAVPAGVEFFRQFNSRHPDELLLEKRTTSPE